MKFLKENDINSIRDVAITLLNFPITPNKMFPFFCSHPFSNCIATYIQSETENKLIPLKLTEEDDYKKWINFMEEEINKWELNDFFININKPYLLTFLKYTKPYMTKSTFSEYLEYCWVIEENPNDDVNCSIPTLIKWFKEADKTILMDKDEYEIYTTLPDNFNIYRGVAVGRNPKGISWTNDYKTAEWFAHRYDKTDKKGYIETLTIKKEDVLAYFNSRNEKEIVLDITNYRNKIIKL